MPGESYPLDVAHSVITMKAKGKPARACSDQTQGKEAAAPRGAEGSADTRRQKGTGGDVSVEEALRRLLGCIADDPRLLGSLLHYVEEDPLIMLTASEVNLDPLEKDLKELLGAFGMASEGNWGMYYLPLPREPLPFVLLKALLAPYDPRLHRQHKNTLRKLTKFLRSQLPAYFRQAAYHRRPGPRRQFEPWEEDRIAAGYQALQVKYKRDRNVTPEAVWETVRPFLPLTPIEDKVDRVLDKATPSERAHVVLGARYLGQQGLQPVPAEVARELWGDLPEPLRPTLEGIIRKKPREMRPYQKARETMAIVLTAVNLAWKVSGSSVEQLVKRHRRDRKRHRAWLRALKGRPAVPEG